MRIRILLPASLMCAAITIGAAVVSAQVPIHGLTGTLALPGNVDKIYDGVSTVVVKTSDGVKHHIRVTKGTKVYGGAEALEALQRGTPVVVHYTMKGDEKSAEEIDRLGDEGLKFTEGVVTAVDKVHKKVTVKYPGGAVETLRLTKHALTEGGAVKGNRVVMYYSNDAGEKVAHYFKRSS